MLEWLAKEIDAGRARSRKIYFECMDDSDHYGELMRISRLGMTIKRNSEYFFYPWDEIKNVQPDNRESRPSFVPTFDKVNGFSRVQAAAPAPEVPEPTTINESDIPF